MALDKSARLWLVDQQMHVLRHHDVASNRKEIAQANALQRIFKKLHGRDRRQVGTTAITTEGEEVELPSLLITDALAFHALRGYSNGNPSAVICESSIPGPQKRGTGGTLSVVGTIIGTGATRLLKFGGAQKGHMSVCRTKLSH